MKALILSADNFEDSELLVPLYRLREVGYSVVVASENAGTIHGKHGYEVPVDKVFSDIHPADYAVLVLPGGKAPAAIRNLPGVQEIARAFMSSGKPVAAICHGPQILISAGLLKGRKATCYESVAPELRDAGAQYQDIEVLVDGNLITSRKPDDLPAFCRELTRLLKAQG
ncbi:type 1 glutamine amidotransferase domain-containing protein [Geomonas azotofigens]|uniref:type 1 glutamine amidotransferase domain-containing protein n=1 Tax=Geomonas azotofigens TaxID=2843196 RepID=UPI001C11CE33|nr:type 1 glutamine amidotransferase domain-containing protein [Geomonas azotofigens]MBU5611816.1 type 1 glutamine amidotransferase [Geomonas azotofigens]